MPAVSGKIVKTRAERLRAAGDLALARHLQRQVGREVAGLVEREGVARAEDFTEIRFTGAAPIGEVVPLRIIGADGKTARAERV